MSKYIVVISVSLLIIFVSFFDFRPKSYSTSYGDAEVFTAKHSESTKNFEIVSESKTDKANSSKVPNEDTEYVLNISTKKYHLPACRYATGMKSENRDTCADLSIIKSEGYSPCKICLK